MRSGETQPPIGFDVDTDQVGLEPILNSVGDGHENIADATPDDGHWNHNHQGNQADE